MNDSFRERLLRLDKITPALKEQYDKEVQAMLEKRLTGATRWGWLGCTVVNMMAAAVLVTFTMIAPPGVPLLARLPVAVAALFSLSFAILGLYAFWRGSFKRKSDTAVYTGMTWAFAVLLATLFIVIAPDSILGLRLILFGLVVLVVGAVFLIRNVIEQTALTAREKLLEIEYCLAGLVETAKSGETQVREPNEDPH